ncbi:unnamed protein product, partial [Toxocara canis]|uniref:Innexin n=1 Tax=Toxocara canis TaxID=6265 RepID=A0A183UR75_TOXCA
MIAVIVPYVGKIRRSYQSNDIVDRLNYQYTTMIITLAALTLAATQYVGKPIQCWVPAQYTETYCFIKGSYFLPFDDDIPHEFSPRDDAVIGYYQWVPIMLALQAFLFYSPSLMDLLGDYLCVFGVWPDGGDAIDRLNYHYTAIVLMVTGLSLAGMLYTMHPIQCWVPAEFLPQWEHYAEVYCFTNGFYHMVEHCDAETTDSDDVCLEDKSVHVGYYQWLPLVAMLQAFMFAIPLCLWRINSGRTGINVSGVLHSAALVKKKFDRGSRTAQVHTAADHLQEALEMQRELKSGSLDCLHFGKRSGIYLIALYLFTKLLYVVNVMVQFLILNAFLGPQYTFWGA